MQNNLTQVSDTRHREELQCVTVLNCEICVCFYLVSTFVAKLPTDNMSVKPSGRGWTVPVLSSAVLLLQFGSALFFVCSAMVAIPGIRNYPLPVNVKRITCTAEELCKDPQVSGPVPWNTRNAIFGW